MAVMGHRSGPWDEDGLHHGTLVAGTISAIGNNDVGDNPASMIPAIGVSLVDGDAAMDLGASGRDDLTGFGLVQAKATTDDITESGCTEASGGDDGGAKGDSGGGKPCNSRKESCP
jgi:hypothetical protein